MTQSLQQRRAAYALTSIRQLVDDAHIDNKALKSVANDLPAQILMNGLGQASALCLSRDTPEHKAMYGLLSGWLCGADGPYQGQTDLLTGITSADMHQYRLAQAEALTLLPWVKRFARAFISEEPDTQEEQP
ncbi:type III-B CRISPR module-associated protein Cmr5 [Ectothiorhodospira haloalkaliphila]|uniref:type III-B CRISPR module-associated protein Cmr5 n=1 Tax=Ectothiorhodospira haloalkaliphila TaxID=421628 RepID=UPI001EE79EFD|nr:type III-B CRISPR module-associated protein Cmr5 [Ectothiorhodospira haloalkaliphila]MCG5525869.1 type III-B CRISPR module-associated protein Cmr5 [Ectothiorhodospira haloalkaliphila]